jgi:spermidine synthase
VLYTGEGLTTSIAISQDDGALTYHGAGKAQASSHLQDMRLQRMLGHLATLSTSGGRSFLVIGLGAGVTAGAVAIDPKAERVVVAEIEPLVPRVVPQYFSAQNFAVVDNPKVEIVVDDGRHYLLTTEEKFDGITSDPLDPWVKGAAALYTREFWQLVKSRLNDGGVVTVFVQLYESTEDAVRSEVATFFDVFPNGVVFANTVEGMGYDAVLLGRAGDAPLDVDSMHTRLRSPEYGLVARSLADVGFSSAVDLLATYAAGAHDLRPWLRDATINTDRNLRLQYLAGEGLNVYRADAIHRHITAGVAFPETLFAGSPALLTQLRQQLRSQRR